MAVWMPLSRPSVSYSIEFYWLPLQLSLIDQIHWALHACADICYLMTTATWLFHLEFWFLRDYVTHCWFRIVYFVVYLFSPMILPRNGGILKRAHNSYWNCTFFFRIQPFLTATHKFISFHSLCVCTEKVINASYLFDEKKCNIASLSSATGNWMGKISYTRKIHVHLWQSNNGIRARMRWRYRKNEWTSGQSN